jgi:hypothetical protein
MREIQNGLAADVLVMGTFDFLTLFRISDFACPVKWICSI